MSLYKKYFLYVTRWVVLAIPGALLLDVVNQYMNVYPAMILTQAFLGAIVFWIDRWILK